MLKGKENQQVHAQYLCPFLCCNAGSIWGALQEPEEKSPACRVPNKLWVRFMSYLMRAVAMSMVSNIMFEQLTRIKRETTTVFPSTAKMLGRALGFASLPQHGIFYYRKNVTLLPLSLHPKIILGGNLRTFKIRVYCATIDIWKASPCCILHLLTIPPP